MCVFFVNTFCFAAFEGASSFNQPIGDWDVSAVSTLYFGKYRQGKRLHGNGKEDGVGQEKEGRRSFVF
mgnify:CR=1 FL=1